MINDPGNVTATVSDGKTCDTGIAAAWAEGNPWFPQMPATKQNDVVKYAVLHIGNNSSLFELTKHGGAAWLEAESLKRDAIPQCIRN
jgi:hypothetical protein